MEMEMETGGMVEMRSLYLLHTCRWLNVVERGEVR